MRGTFCTKNFHSQFKKKAFNFLIEKHWTDGTFQVIILSSLMTVARCECVYVVVKIAFDNQTVNSLSHVRRMRLTMFDTLCMSVINSRKMSYLLDVSSNVSAGNNALLKETWFLACWWTRKNNRLRCTWRWNVLQGWN